MHIGTQSNSKSMSPNKIFRPMTSPAKRSTQSPNKSFRSPERMRMINEQEDKLNHLSEEMENLRAQHPSAFKSPKKQDNAAS